MPLAKHCFVGSGAFFGPCFGPEFLSGPKPLACSRNILMAWSIIMRLGPELPSLWSTDAQMYFCVHRLRLETCCLVPGRKVEFFCYRNTVFDQEPSF